jgi:hypothetical protein
MSIVTAYTPFYIARWYAECRYAECRFTECSGAISKWSEQEKYKKPEMNYSFRKKYIRDRMHFKARHLRKNCELLTSISYASSSWFAEHHVGLKFDQTHICQCCILVVLSCRP